MNLVEFIDCQSKMASANVASLPSTIEEAPRWLAPPTSSYKVNVKAVVLDSDVGTRAIVCDSNGDVMLAMESHFPMTGSVELAKVIVMFNGISFTIKTGIYFLWVKFIPIFYGAFWLGILDLQTRFRFRRFYQRSPYQWYILGFLWTKCSCSM